MLLFRIINLNTSGVFVYLSYSPLIFIYFVLCLFIMFGISIWSYTIDVISNVCLLILFIAALSLLFIDIIIDNFYGINESVTLYSTMQYCFIWFVLSEAALFLSFFWGAFALTLLMSLEFSVLIGTLPVMYSYSIINYGFVFYWFYLDLLNIIINTMFLFFSGIFCNFFYLSLFYNSYNVSYIFCLLSLILGYMFIWNQLWEFSILAFNISVNSFCTVLYTIDILHFSHVSLGVFLIFLSMLKILNKQVQSTNIIFFTCIIFYWHFVDFVWFILLRFIYFNILCTVFLI